MNDEDFLSRFADCSLDPGLFDHAAHLRLACLMLQRYPFDEAVRRTCAGIRAFATHLGAADKFHWTISEAFVRILYAEGQGALQADARARLARHYSAAALADPAARVAFVAPDLAPLP